MIIHLSAGPPRLVNQLFYSLRSTHVAIKAIQVVLGCEVHIRGCFYRLTQSTFTTKMEIKLSVEMLVALASQPIDDVADDMKHIRYNISECGESLVHYFDRTYASGTV